MSESNSDRRRYHRAIVALHASASRGDTASELVPVETLNLSEGGVAFLGPQAFEVEETVQYRMANGEGWIGRVLACDPEGDRFHVRLEFVQG